MQSSLHLLAFIGNSTVRTISWQSTGEDRQQLDHPTDKCKIAAVTCNRSLHLKTLDLVGKTFPQAESDYRSKRWMLLVGWKRKSILYKGPVAGGSKASSKADLWIDTEVTRWMYEMTSERQSQAVQGLMSACEFYFYSELKGNQSGYRWAELETAAMVRWKVMAVYIRLVQLELERR
jgi:hypothetical protein